MPTAPDDRAPQMRVPYLTGLPLVHLRGILLWIVVPLAILFWAIMFPIWHSRNVRLGHFIGWADLNLIAALHRTLFRPFVRNPLP